MLFATSEDRFSRVEAHLTNVNIRVNSVDPDLTAPIEFLYEQSDLGLHCLTKHFRRCFFLFDLILYVPVNNLSVISGQVFLG